LNAGAAWLQNAYTHTEPDNVGKLGNGIIAMSFKLENDCHIHQPVPSKLETEPMRMSSHNSLSSRYDETSHKDGRIEASYEYCLMVVRRMESKGYIWACFRLNFLFLTLFCLRATPHEMRTVSVFVDILIDDPASLDSQLCDTFSDAIYRKGAPHWPFIFGVELKP
jgi:hypothetical protein